MRVVNAADVRLESIEYLWENRIPRGMITIIGGRPEQGKGLFVAYLAAKRSQDAKVLYSAHEDSFGLMTAPRLVAVGANMRNIDLTRFRLPHDWEWLESKLMTENIDVVIIDPLASHLSGGIRRGSDRIREVVDPLAELAERTDTAVVIVDHVLKNVPRTAHPLSAIGGGSSGMVAAARMAFLLGKDHEDPDRRLLCCVKSNIMEKPSEYGFRIDSDYVAGVDGEIAFLVEEGETIYNPMQFLAVPLSGRSGGSRPPVAKAFASEWMSTYLYDMQVPQKASEVLAEGVKAGHARKTLREASRMDSGIVKDPPHGGPGCVWMLSDEKRNVMDMMHIDLEQHGDPFEELLKN